MRRDEQPGPYRDLDLMLFGPSATIPDLGPLSYDVLLRLPGIEIDRRHLKGKLLTKWHQIKKDLDFRSGLVVRPESGKVIDVFISAVPVERYFERSTRPYVILH